MNYFSSTGFCFLFRKNKDNFNKSEGENFHGNRGENLIFLFAILFIFCSFSEAEIFLTYFFLWKLFFQNCLSFPASHPLFVWAFVVVLENLFWHISPRPALVSVKLSIFFARFFFFICKFISPPFHFLSHYLIPLNILVLLSRLPSLSPRRWRISTESKSINFHRNAHSTKRFCNWNKHETRFSAFAWIWGW